MTESLTTSSVISSNEIVFVLDNLSDLATLLAGLPAGTEVYQLDANGDALAQMAAILEQRSGISAIHLFCHGSAGSLDLGSVTLDSSNLGSHADALATIGAALAPEADWLIYGCDVAQGDVGQVFVSALAEWTGADVAASTNLTGSTALGGDWVLEQSTGTIETNGVVSVATMADYDALLANPVVGTQADKTMLEDKTLQFSGFAVSYAGGSLLEAVVTLDDPTRGLLKDGTTVGSTLRLQGDLASINTFLNRLIFASAANVNGVASITVTVNAYDNGYAQPSTGTSTDSFDVSVTAVNDAPSGADKTISLDEDGSYTFAATDFALTDLADEPAPNLLSAVKITTLPASGTLRLNGVNVTAGQWVSLADITAGKLVFTPPANANGAAYSSFTFQVKDNGGVLNSGVDLDPTANTITINVTALNDAPVAAGTATLAAVNEDANAAALAGATVSSLLAARFSDVDTQLGSNKTLAGVAIIANAEDGTHGHWEYSTDTGASWTQIPTSGLSDSAALVLGVAASDLIRFNPDAANFNGTPGALTVRLSDGTAFVAGAGQDISGGVGGVGGWSNAITLGTTVTAVDDAPVISEINGDTLVYTEAIGTNVAGPAVLLDSIILSGAATLSDIELTVRGETAFTGATLTVVDHAGASANDLFVLATGSNGVTITGAFTEPYGLKLFANGSSVDFNGTSVATLSNNSATGTLVLTFKAAATSAAVDAILRSLAYANTRDALSSSTKNVDIVFTESAVNTGQGAGYPLSATATVQITLVPINDAPSFSAGVTLTATEDITTGGQLTTTPATPVTLASLLSAKFVDPDGLTGNFAGVAISGFTDAGLGSWQVSIDAGATWTALSELAASAGGLSVSNALLLAANAQLQFIALTNANTSGATAPSLTVYAVEAAIPADVSSTHAPAVGFTTDQASPITYDTTADTLESRVSAAAQTVLVTIASRNDTPTLDTSGGMNQAWSGTLVEISATGMGTSPQQLVSNASVGDPDLATTAVLSSTTFGAGSITVHLASANASDQFTVAGSPTGVASQTGGVNGADLVINLAATATIAEVNAILEAIRFQSTSDTPTAATRTYTITLSDGNNTQAGGNAGGPAALSVQLSGSITLVAVNDPPALDLNGALAGNTTTVTWTEGSNVASVPVAIAPAAVLSDADNSNLTGMTITVAGVLDGNHEVVTIGGQQFLLGTDYSNVTVGSFRLSYTGGVFTILPGSGATATVSSYQTLLRGITYNEPSIDIPTAGDRTFTVQLSDAGTDNSGATLGNDLLTSISQTITLTVVPANDQPVLAGLDAVSYAENTINVTPAFLDTSITLTDIDSASYNGGSVTVSNLKAGEDRVSLPTSAAEVLGNIRLSGTNAQYFDGSSWLTIGTASGGNGSNFVVSFNANATRAIAQRVVENLTFANTSDAPATSRTLTIAVNDGGSGTAQTATVSVGIVTANDAPTVSFTNQIANLVMTADNAFVVYLNGVQLGSGNDWGSPYNITNVNVQSGTNVLAVYATDLGGIAAMQAKLTLPSGATIGTSDAGWLVTNANPGSAAWQVAGYDTSAWVAPTDWTYKNPWGGSRITPAQNWIWTAYNERDGVIDGQDYDHAWFRYEFTATAGTGGTKTYFATEQVALALQGTGISLADPDLPTGVVQATVSLPNDGTHTGKLAVNVGNSGVTIGSSTDKTLVLNGTLTQLNALFGGTSTGTLTYTADSDTPVESVPLTVAINDLGGSGTGVALSASDFATISVTAVNDGPTISAIAQTYTDTVNDDTFANWSGTFTASDAETARGDLGFSLTGSSAVAYTAGGISYDLGKVGTYGTFYLKSTTGEYVYVPNDGAIEALFDTKTESFSVTVTDKGYPTPTLSASTTVTLTLNGTDDTNLITLGTVSNFTEQTANRFLSQAIVDAPRDGLKELKIQLENNKTGDTLSYTTVTGITGAYNASTGILTLSSTNGSSAADFQTVLRSITFNNTLDNPDPTTRTFVVSTGAVTPYFTHSDGYVHYYQFVTSAGIDWNAARDAAAAMTYNGLSGYLATITSEAENTFAASKLNGQGWFGGSDDYLYINYALGTSYTAQSQTEQKWFWVTGPEAGQQFSTGSTAFDGRYINWASGEPNNAGGENVIHFLSNGRWNDYNYGNNSIQGYVVEFGGYAGNPTVSGLSSGGSVAAQGSFTVTLVNDAPAITGMGSITYTEQATAAVIAASAVVTDPDELGSINFGGGYLRAALTSNGTAADQLSIVATGGITVADGIVLYSGVEIGTIDATENGANGVALKIALNTSASKAATQALLRAIGFSNGIDDPSNLARTVTFTLNDGQNVGTGTALNATGTATVNFTSVNDAPLASGSISGTYTEGDAGTLMFVSGVTVSDVDASQFNGGSLRVAFGTYVAGDVLQLVDGNGITHSGSSVSYNGAVIGTISGGAAADLVISLTSASATYAAVQALAQQVAYSTSNQNPTVAGAQPTRAVTVTLNDGGNTSSSGAATPKTVAFTGQFNVMGINDAPTLTGLDVNHATTLIQGGAALVIDSNAVLGDLDLEALTGASPSGNWSGGVLTIARSDGAGGYAASADDVFSASGNLSGISAASGNLVLSGTTIGSYTRAGGTLTLTFNSSATTARVNEALHSITYANALTTPGALAYDHVVLRVGFNDENTNTTGAGVAGDATGAQNQGGGGLASVSATIDIVIDRLPVAVADSASLSEGLSTSTISNVSGALLSNDSDPDNGVAPSSVTDTLRVQGVSAGTTTAVLASNVGSAVTGSYGSITVASNGSYTYTLDNSKGAVQALAVGQQLHDVFSYTVADGRGGTTNTTLDVTVNGTNDAPQILTSSGDTVQLTTGNANPTFRLAIPATGVVAGDTVRLSYLGQTQTGQVITATDIANGYVEVTLSATLQDASSALDSVPVKWIDWTSKVDSGATHTVSGTFTTESGSVNATLTNSVGFAFVQTSGGTNYFNPTTPYVSTGVAAPTSSDIIAFNPHGTRTLTFSEPVTNLYFAYVSLNGNGYRFDRDFDIVSQGRGYWGEGTMVKVTNVIDGVTYYELNATGGEPHGVIRFKDTFSEVTWTTTVDENWNGFTLGIKSSLSGLENVQGQFLHNGTVVATSPTTQVTYDPTLTALTGTLDTTVSAARILETNAALTTSGSLSLYDVDTANVVTVSVDAVSISGVTSGLTLDNSQVKALLSAVSTDTGLLQGSRINWTFNSTPENFNWLAEGEELTFSYSISVDDQSGGTDSSTITVTIVGTNDTPVLSPGVVAAALTEGSGVLTSTGSVSFTDTDLSNTVAARVLNDSAVWTGGTLSAAQQTALYAGLTISPASQGHDGTVDWTYSTTESVLDFIASGQTVTLKFYIEVKDSSGAAVSQLVTVTVTGTNDVPVISLGAADAASAAITETSTTLSATDTLTVTDVDITNTVLASVPAVTVFSGRDNGISNASLLSMLSVSPSAIISASQTTGTLTWTFNSGAQYFDYLEQGETLVLDYTVRATDSSSTTANQTVRITLTGSNDLPTLTIAAPTAVSEQSDARVQDLLLSGNLVITDKDIGNTLTPSQGTPTVVWSGGAAPAGYDLSALTSAGVLTLGAVGTSTGGTVNIGWSYDPSALNLDFLAAGQTLTVTYPVTLTDEALATSSANLVITITGSNDAPVISVGGSDSAAKTLTESNAGLSTSGTLSVTDLDYSNTVTAQVLSVTKSDTTTGITPSDATLKAYLSLASSAIIDATHTTGTISWAFNSASEAFNYLSAGEQLTLSYTVRATDSSGATADQTVVITITGSNDLPVITNGPDTLALTETNAALSGSGTLTVSDVDYSNTVTASVDALVISGTSRRSDAAAPSDAALKAMLSVSPTAILDATHTTNTLSWSFNSAAEVFNYLAAGETLVLAYSVKALDSSGTSASETVTVTITGSNDAPLITLNSGAGDSAAATLAETSAALSTSGTLTVSDVDTSNTVAASVVSVVASGTTVTLGSDNAALKAMLSVDATNVITSSANTGTLHWAFASSSERFDYLAAGESLTLTYTVRATDSSGAAANQAVVITITGSNDAPVISVGGSDSAAKTLTESNAGLSTSGTLSVTDLDYSNTVTAQVLSVTKSDTTTGITPSDATLKAYLSLASSAIIDATHTTGTISWAFNSASEAFNYLSAGEQLTLSYTVRATDSSGATADQTVVITITGSNDLPVITNGPDTLALTETNAALSGSGTLTVSDVDYSNTVTASVDALVISGTSRRSDAAAPSDAALKAMLSVSPTAILDATHTTNTLSWSFNSAAEVFNYLAAGETLVLAYSVKALDSSGTSASETVTVTITGSNDAPLITLNSGAGDSAAATLAETSAALSTSGTLTVSDVDTSNTVAASVVSVVASGTTVTLGSDNAALKAMLSVDATNVITSSANTGTLHWAFASSSERFDYLAAGESLTLTYTVRATDSSGAAANQAVVITITGSNDAPVISVGGSDSAAKTLTESNAGLSTSGTLSVTDLDYSNTVTAQVLSVTKSDTTTGITPSDATLKAYLSLASSAIIDATHTTGTISWAFNSASEAFNYLSAGEQLTLSYTVRATDSSGATADQTVVITITGTNDAPLITAEDLVGAVTEQTGTPTGNLTDSGTMTFTDVDLTDVHLVSGTGTSVTTNLGVLTAVKTGDTTGTGAGGSLSWTYTVADSAVEYLAKNQTRVESFTITLSDQNGSVITKQIDVTITGTNDAPVLSATPVLTLGQSEDDGLPVGTVGTLVSGLLAGVSDVDNAALQGVAITGADSAHGSWYFTINGGTSWTAFSASDASALLLAPTARVYFKPVADWHGSVDAALTLRAWDQSSGANGSAADLSAAGSTGGDTAYSSASDTVTLTVGSVNDRPVATANVTLSAYTEDTTPAGIAISTLGASLGYSDATDDQSGVAGNNNATGFSYLAIVGSAGYTAEQGQWQVSVNGGASWITVPVSGLSASAALVFAASAQLRFVPAANYFGTPGTLTVRLADGSASLSTSTSATNTLSLTADGGTGVTGSWSAVDRVLGTTVSGINDAPTVSGNALLTATDEDMTSATTSAATAAGLLSYSDTTDNQSVIGGGANAATAQTALAIVGNAASASQGSWQYTLDGSIWVNVATGVSDTTAIVLTLSEANHQIRFVPTANYHGVAGVLTVRVADGNWNGSAGVQDISASVGTTGAWSASTATLGQTVNSVNDAPAILGLDAMSVNASNDQPYRPGTGAVIVIDPDVTLVDPELATENNNWNGATLTVTRNGGANSDDVFGASGTAANGLYLSAGNMLVDGITVGSYTHANGTLVLSFNAAATAALVNTAVQGITYSNTNPAPTYAKVTLDYTVNDHNSNTTDGGSNGGGQDQGALGQLSSTAQIEINFNNPPVANPDALVLAEGVSTTSISTLSGNVITAASAGDVTDTDKDADPLVIQGVVKGLVSGVVASGVDTAVVTGNVGTAVAGDYGTLVLGSDGSYIYTLNNTLASVQALAAGESATDVFSYTINDGRGGRDSTTLTVTITGTNDAPVLGAAALFINQFEDDPIPVGTVGQLVSTLTGAVSDVDHVALKGVAITSVDNTHGDWYYTVDGGTNWTLFTASAASALLLGADANTRVYFQPDLNWNGNVISALTLQAWDQTSGSVAGRADLSAIGASGGTTAFSNTSTSVSLKIQAINDAPVFYAAGTVAADYIGSAVTAPATSMDYVFNGPQVLNAELQVYDVELAGTNGPAGNYDGATLTLSREGGANAADQFFGLNGLLLSGTSVVYAGSTVGKFTHGGGQLVITFNINATQDRVNGVLQNIGYANGADAPANDQTVTLLWVFSDLNNNRAQGEGGVLIDSLRSMVTLKAITGPLTLTGSTGADTLTGGPDADSLTGGAGIDRLLGGDGADLYVMTSSTDHAAAEINDSGTRGTDEVRFTSVTAGQTLKLFAGDEGIEAVVIGTGADMTADTTGTTALSVDASLVLNGLTLTGNDGINTLTGTAFADEINGGAGDDVINAGVGNDTIDGGTGIDRMTGGDGDDIYYVDNAGDVVTESSTVGEDTVYTTASFTLSAYVENLYLLGAATSGTGSAQDNVLVGNELDNLLAGMAGNDTLTGLVGNDVLDGGAGADRLDGGEGSDIYLFGLSTDHAAAEIGDSGTGDGEVDEVRFASTTAGQTLTLFAGDSGIERVVIGTGTAANAVSTASTALNVNAAALGNALTIIGNAGANILTGTADDDSVTGGAGNDTFTGGGGNDSFNIDAGSDTVTDLTSGDLLKVSSGATVTANNVLVFAATSETTNAGTATLKAGATNSLIDMRLAGGTAGYTLAGAAGVDTLLGSAWADTLTGGAGNDSLTGGAGNDTFNVDAGSDNVTDLTTGDVLKVLAGASATAQVVTAFVASATTTNAGTATLNALSAGGVIDMRLAAGTVGFVLNGGSGNDTLIGSKLADTLTGGHGDTLTGFGGIDSFRITGGTVSVTDLGYGGAGVLRVEAGATVNATVTAAWTATSATLNLGTANILSNGLAVNLTSANAATAGAQGFNVSNTGATATTLTGSALNDTLSGGSGADTLVGGGGDDALTGGAGLDTFVIASGTDTLTDLGNGGADVLKVSAGAMVNATVVAAWTATSVTTNSGMVNLTTNGLAVNLTAVTTGTNGFNVTNSSAIGTTLTGSAKNDVLTGGSGNDILVGGAGVDTMDGGEGSDIYLFGLSTDHAAAEIGDSGTGDGEVDEVRFASTTAGQTLTLFAGDSGIERVVIGTGTAANAVSTASTALNVNAAALGNALTIIGNAGANILTGTADDDSVTGGAGNDTFTGGGGNDSFNIDAGSDTVTDLTSGDLLKVSSGATVTANNVLVFAATSETTNAGTATLKAGATNSLIDMRLAGGTAGYTLAGAAGVDTLLGSAWADTLTGGAGNDSLTGGAGNDTFNVDAGSDTVTDLTTGDVLKVLAGASATAQVVTAFVASATTTNAGTATLNALSAGGVIDMRLAAGTVGFVLNGGSGNDTLIGSKLADTLTGGHGDTLTGFGGIDSFRITGGTVSVTDLGYGGAGVLRVEAGATVNATVTAAWTATSATLNLGTANILSNGLAVNLTSANATTAGAQGFNVSNTGATATTLTGSALNDTLSGGSGADTLVGGGGDDRLIGGLGKDVLTGGLGGDTFVFNHLPTGTTNYDTVVDFVAGTDKLEFAKSVFTGLAGTSADFVTGAGVASASTTAQHLIYNTTTGLLYYDADGSGTASAAVAVALIGTTTHTTLSANDFVVV